MRIILTRSARNADNENHSQELCGRLGMRIILTVLPMRSPLQVRPVFPGRSPYIWVGFADRFLGAPAACQSRRVPVTAPPDQTGSPCRTLCQYIYCPIISSNVTAYNKTRTKT